MKRDRLYTVNKGNIFGLGDQLNKLGKVWGADELSTGTSGMIGALSSTVGQIGGGLIGGGLQSGAGSAISNIGGTIGGAISQVNPLIGGIVSAGSGLIGGLANRAFGSKMNEGNIAKVEEGIAGLRRDAGGLSQATDSNSLLAAAGNIDYGADFSNSFIGKDGWFSNKAKRKANELRKKQEAARAYAAHGLMTGAENVDSFLDDNVMGNFAAFGGLLPQGDAWGTVGGPAIDYGFMQDWLNNKRKKAEEKSGGTAFNLPASFAFGGDMQSNSADFSTGLVHINAGQSHELNPNDGVQVGVDPEGVPNLVEENEVIWNDYVFSNRIKCDATTKEKFHFPKKKDITYAEAAKKLEKEIAERPNDPVSKSGFKAQMETLEEQQERQKAEMEAKRAEEAFEALSDEEKVAVMQQVAQEESARQNLAGLGEEQAMQEMAGGAQSDAQVLPEEMPTEDAVDTVAPQEVIGQTVMAEGGNLFEDGGDKKKNVGSWKNDKENHWDIFTRPGLKRYLESIKQRLAMAPDDATKEEIRREAINDLNGLQQSYYDYVREGAGKAVNGFSEDILNHQKRFDKMYGNIGFYSTDENGNIKNLIAEAISLPKGAATEDKPDSWFDGYNGPRTSIRNFGSTEYGDDAYYKDLVDDFAKLGLNYAPNENWKYGDNKLYGLSLGTTNGEEEEPKRWDWNKGDWTTRGAETRTTPAGNAAGTVKENGEEEKKIKPVLRAEWPRYLGLFGPAVGLGMQLAGIGKPKTGMLDSVLADYDKRGTRLAKWKPIGNYLTYNPMDIWFEQNRMDANARATDRAILNSASPSRIAGLLANGYNSQLASGDLYRKALEYNDAKRHQVAEFNRGTDQYNSQAYNQNQQFNANALNHSGQYRAGLAAQIANQKMNADAGWYNSLYGNVGGLFKGLADLGRENAERNMIARLAASGALPGIIPDNTINAGLVKSAACGGKIKRKKSKRGLTI